MKRGRGRPRSLDRDVGIAIAERLFWERGYENTSIADLTAAMGITPPSLYAAFGSKEYLFRLATEFFAADNAALFDLIEEAPTGYQAMRSYLRTIAEFYSDPATPRGCMIATAMLHTSQEHAGAAEIVAAMRREFREKFEARFEQSVSEGELPAGTDTAGLARFVAAIVQGMSVQATDGATWEDLSRLVDAALAGWPGERK